MEFGVYTERESDMKKAKGWLASSICLVLCAGVVSASDTATGSGNGVAYGTRSTATAATSVAVGQSASATGTASVAVGNRASASGTQTVAIGQRATASNTYNVVVGLNAGAGSATQGASSTYLGTSAGYGYTSTSTGTGDLLVGSNAGASASGYNNTYVGQSNAGANSSGYANASLGTGAFYYSTGNSNTALGYAAGQRLTGDSNVSIGKNSNYKMTGSYNIAIGEEANTGATGDHNVAIGNKANSDGTNSYVTALGDATTVSQDGGVALGYSSVADRAAGSAGYDISGETADDSATWVATGAAVSVGSSALTRQIINVAAGSQDTDAVNVAQLKTAKTEVIAGNNIASVVRTTGDDGQSIYTVNAKGTAVTSGSSSVSVTSETDDATALTTYSVGLTADAEAAIAQVSTNTDAISGLSTQLGNTNSALSDLREESRQGDAMGAALSALKPMQYDPLEPTQIMAGVGVYRETSAVALGLAHYKNESMLLHAGVAWANASNSHLMANAGITWKVGGRSGENAVPDKYKAGPISSVYVMQDEIQSLQAQNDALEHQNRQLIADVELLKEQVATLLASR